MNLKNKMNEQKVQLIPSDLYEKIHMAMPMACVDIIITNINSFLLAKRKNKPAKNQWWFPGGRILKNETLAEAVARKSFEETGLKVEIINRIGVEETIFPDGPFNFSEINEGWHPYVKNFLKIAGFK